MTQEFPLRRTALILLLLATAIGSARHTHAQGGTALTPLELSDLFHRDKNCPLLKGYKTFGMDIKGTGPLASEWCAVCRKNDAPAKKYVRVDSFDQKLAKANRELQARDPNYHRTALERAWPSGANLIHWDEHCVFLQGRFVQEEKLKNQPVNHILCPKCQKFGTSEKVYSVDLEAEENGRPSPPKRSFLENVMDVLDEYQKRSGGTSPAPRPTTPGNTPPRTATGQPAQAGAVACNPVVQSGRSRSGQPAPSQQVLVAPTGGGPVFATVSAGSNCGWRFSRESSGDGSWIDDLSPLSGMGPGTLTFAISALPAALERDGRIRAFSYVAPTEAGQRQPGVAFVIVQCPSTLTAQQCSQTVGVR
jgi:hypothetical protein